MRKTAVSLMVAGMLAALAALAGCAGGVKDVMSDPGLDPGALLAGRMVVAGVAARVDSVDPVLRDRCGDALFGSFLAGRPDLEIWPQSSLAGAIGDSAHAALLDRVGFAHEIAPARLAGIADVMPGVRFLAVGRIDRDRTELSSSNTAAEARTLEDGSYDSALHVATDYRRRIEVTLTVYDLAAGEAVWTGVADRSRKISHSQFEDSGKRASGGLAGRFAGSPGAPESPPDPTPDLAEMVGRAFADLIARLPAVARER